MIRVGVSSGNLLLLSASTIGFYYRLLFRSLGVGIVKETRRVPLLKILMDRTGAPNFFRQAFQ